MKHNLLKAFLLFATLVFLSFNQVYCQEHGIEKLVYNEKDYDLKGKTHHPALLVAELTKNKTSDKEKFDAIFGWVAVNIGYDYEAYYSSGGSGQPGIRKILKSRRAICIDYANLMDSLCALAGIPNVTIYGYAKDEIFDVNDSLYLDNHAWNAVKLGEEWYLYDVTWSTGEAVYTFTRWSRFILKLLDKHKPRYKAFKIGKDKRLVFSKECNLKDEPVYYFRQRYLNRLLIHILHSFRLKTKNYYKTKLNTDFYLSDPKVFGITHYPDDPNWAFLPGSNMRKFERDSAFYHLNSGVYAAQQPRGSICPACDSSLQQDKENYFKQLKRNSFLSNKRNRFITALCDNSVGEINYTKYILTEDSLTRIMLIDTAMFNFVQAQTSLGLCKTNVSTDFVLQKNKNKLKQDQLLTDNKKHSKFIRKKIKVTRSESRNNRELFNKISAVADVQRQLKKNLKALNTEIKAISPGKKSSDRIAKLLKETGKLELKRDSVNALLVLKKGRFDSLSVNLSLNTWQKAMHHNDLLEPFEQSLNYRRMLKDNFKKDVVETRKLIYQYENKYEEDINDLLYYPSENCARLGTEIFKLTALRDNLSKDYFRKKTELLRRGELPVSELTELKTTLINENKDSYCWMESKAPAILSTYMGFDFLALQQRRIEGIINYESSIERNRLSTVYDEISRRKRKYNAIISHNSSYLRVLINRVKKEKRRYLKSLKKRRKT